MSFFRELRRRNVVRVAIAYLIMAWLLLQIVDVIVPMLELPNWIGRAILLLLAVGFAVSVFVAWAFEITPEGLKKEKDVDRSQSITHVTGRKLDFVIIGVLVVALGFFAIERFVWHDHDETSVAATSQLEKSIAVIPFANRSADEADAYFVDGIHDDILTQLSKLSGIDRVISRTSVERYRDTDLSVPEIAAELGVATILEGSVQRAGDRVRITMQLIDAAKDEHIWADNFDRELTANNVFDIQSEISTAIATSLQTVLTDDEANDLTKLPTESLAAWEKYQLGKYAGQDRSIDGLEQARTYFEEAIELDEEFALAHVGLANTIVLESSYRSYVENFTQAEFVEAMDEARSVAQQALSIDPDLGEAFTAIGYAHFMTGYTENYLQADDYYRKAVDLTPNDSNLFRWYPQILWLRPLNQPAEALSMAERAVALDPMNSTSFVVLALAYEMNGRYEEAARSFDRAIEILPKNVYAVRENIIYLRRHAEYSRAVIAGMDALAWLPDYSAILYAIAQSYRQLGETDKYRYWSERTLETGLQPYVAAVGAMSALDEGRIDTAIQQLQSVDYEWEEEWPIIYAIAHALARNDQPDTLLNFLEQHVPELLDRANPEVWPQDAMLVAATAWAFSESGDEAHADKLVELGMEVARTGPRQANFGYGVEIADVEMHAVQGNYRFALEALTQAVEEGYRNPEWLERSHFLDPLRSEPEFVAAMDVIRAEMAAQLAELEAMEASGELPASPQ